MFREIPHLSSFPTSFVQRVLWDIGVLGRQSHYYCYNQVPSTLLDCHQRLQRENIPADCSLRHEKEARLLPLVFLLGAQLISNPSFLPSYSVSGLTFLLDILDIQ